MASEPTKREADVSAPRLHGWDDEKVYFWSPQAGEQCVSDEPELLQELLGVCSRYFEAASGKTDP